MCDAPINFFTSAGYHSKALKSCMTEIARTLSRITGLEVEVESLKSVLIFTGISLIVSLLAVQTFGLDLSAGLF